MPAAIATIKRQRIARRQPAIISDLDPTPDAGRAATWTKSAHARTWSSPTAAQPLGRPHQAPLYAPQRPLRSTASALTFSASGRPADR
ncbi:hypothetical protein J7E70_26680 [Variovorax paradoxus]|nr:hypothetical protein [Variovorax paradoxus]MBT2304029.1 hypothetical protein [Variovorax paradoxus]